MKKLPAPIEFNWDQGNINKNRKKHKVHFKEAEETFFDERIKIFPDIAHSINEKRFIALGRTNNKRYLAVIFTIRGAKIRVISARNMNRKERGEYEKTIKDNT